MKKILFFLSPLILGLVMYSCKKNNDGPPMITNVRFLDTTRPGNITGAIPGTEIVIQGSSLDGALAVYFNDTSAYFNPVYNTSSNLIVTIPSTSQTAAANLSVPNIIKVVTSHGTATYSFTLFLPPPAISSITFDNSGTMVYINGSNFQGIQKIVFPTPNKDTAVSYTVNKTFTQITAVIPKGTALQDSLRVYCLFGVGSFSYPPPMAITSVSNENAAAGATITFTGTNFVGISSVIFPGGKLGTNIQVQNVNQFTVTVPSGITTADSVTVIGALGKAVAPILFNNWIKASSPGYISTFETQWNADYTGYMGWTSTYITGPSTTYPNGTGNFISFTGSAPKTGSTNWYWNNAMAMRSNSVQWVVNPSTANASDYVLRFEAYINFDWKVGGVYFTTNSTGGSYNYEWAPWKTAASGVYHPSGWVTVTIPLTSITKGTYNSAWQYNPSGTAPSKVTDLTGSTGNDQLFVYVTNFTSNDINGIDLAFDNFRIVKIK